MAAVLPLFSGTASGTGTAFAVLVGRRIAFSMSATGGSVGTASLQGSFDGSAWFGLEPVPQGSYGDTDALVAFVRAVYDDGGHSGTATVQALQSDEDG